MAWAAVIKDTRDDGASLVVLNDDTRSYTQWLASDGTLVGLRGVVLAWIAGQETLQGRKSEIAPGTIIDCTPIVVDPPTPTPEETRRAAFTVADRRLDVLLRDVNKTYVAADDTIVSDARTLAVSLYDPSYRESA